MILYRLAKWMEEQESKKDRSSSPHQSSSQVFQDHLNDQFPLMKQEVERFRKQVPYLT